MLKYTILTLATMYTLAACDQKGKYFARGEKDLAGFVSKDTGRTIVQPKIENAGYNDPELQLFCNIEITPYCVLLPLHEFGEVLSDKSIMKAQHKFLLKKDTTHFTSIELQAFTIDSKHAYNTGLFYKRDRNDIEESGLGIDTAYMDEKNHYYLVKGYLPNYPNMRYMQLNWILEDRIAVYINYEEKEEALWQGRIAAIIKRGVAYKE